MADEPDDPKPGEASYSMDASFYIDTDGYSDRDREMFTCGVEWQKIYAIVKRGGAGTFNIHSENSSRFRMLFAKMKRKCEIRDTEFSEWKTLEIIPQNGPGGVSFNEEFGEEA